MVTVTSTTPVPAGLVATICVDVSLVIVAAVPPNMTAVASPKLAPVIVTVVPPVAGPDEGLTPLTIGCGGNTVTLTLLVVEPPVSESAIVTVNV